MEDFILDTLDNASKINFPMVFRSIGIALLILWFFVLVWVWMDSGLRTRNWLFRIASVLVVAVFNILGLIIYLLIRPKQQLEDIYWSDLERRYLLYETADLGDCDNCGFHLHPGFNVCPNCSYPLKKPCSNCNLMLNKDWAFCPYCSTQQDEVMSDQELIESAKQMTLAGAAAASAAGLRDESEEQVKKGGVKKDLVEPKKEEVAKEVREEVVEKEEVVESAQSEERDDVIKPTQEEIDKSIEDKDEAIDESIKEDPAQYKRNKGAAERLGSYIITSVYSVGEKIHKTALSVSGPLREPSTKSEVAKEESPEVVNAPVEENKQESETKPKSASKKKSSKRKSTSSKSKKK